MSKRKEQELVELLQQSREEQEKGFTELLKQLEPQSLKPLAIFMGLLYDSQGLTAEQIATLKFMLRDWVAQP